MFLSKPTTSEAQDSHRLLAHITWQRSFLLNCVHTPGKHSLPSFCFSPQPHKFRTSLSHWATAPPSFEFLEFPYSFRHEVTVMHNLRLGFVASVLLNLWLWHDKVALRCSRTSAPALRHQHLGSQLKILNPDPSIPYWGTQWIINLKDTHTRKKTKATLTKALNMGNN